MSDVVFGEASGSRLLCCLFALGEGCGALGVGFGYPGGDGVERIRLALSTYEIALARPAAHLAGLDVDRMASAVEHAWRVYQHARYPDLVRILPNLIAIARRTHAQDPSGGRAALVDVYRVTASLLVKLGEADLAWLAADRAMATATGDVVLVAGAAVQVGQVLRAADRARAAMSVVLPAAYRIAPPDCDDGPPGEMSLCGALLVQAALAAARQGDEWTVTELIDGAAEIADRVGDGHDYHRTSFGPAAVHLARVTAALELGDGREAVAWHEKTSYQDGWRCLPTEHRAAYLLDAARAYLAGVAAQRLDQDVPVGLQGFDRAVACGASGPPAEGREAADQ